MAQDCEDEEVDTETTESEKKGRLANLEKAIHELVDGDLTEEETSYLATQLRSKV